MPPLRVLIVSENISMQMGGESSLPHYYAKLFLRRGIDVWLACHERVEASLFKDFPELGSRIRLVRDTPAQKLLFRFGRVLPYRLRDMIVGQFIHLSTQDAVAQDCNRTGARWNDRCGDFEPAPITPKGLSFMYDVPGCRS